MRKLLGHLNLETLLCEFLRNAHLELDEGLQRPHQQDSILSSCCPAALNNILTYLTSHGSSVPQLPRFLRRPSVPGSVCELPLWPAASANKITPCILPYPTPQTLARSNAAPIKAFIADEEQLGPCSRQPRCYPKV